MKIVPFEFNRVQRILWNKLRNDYLRQGRPIRWLILKGRQMGLSTWIAGCFYWVCSLRSNRNAVVAAHKEDSSSELFRKQQLFFRESPQDVRPMVKTNNRGHLEFANPNTKSTEKGLESQILVDVISNVDLGRAFSLHLLHLSEFAMVNDPTPTLVAARNAMPDLPGTFLVIETTAKGPGPFKDLWDDKDNDYEKIFICWIADENYRLELDPDEYFELHSADHPKYGNEVQEQERVIRELRIWYPELDTEDKLFHESMCRLAWRRKTIDKECSGDIRMFRQEYPTIPNDAFIGTGKTLFDSYKLADLIEAIDLFPPKFYSYRFDFNKHEFEPRRYGPLKLFEPIQPDTAYVIGVDPALGVEGGDPSAAVILRCPELIQAGVFCAVISPDEFAVLLYYLGELFNWGLLGVEANEEGGYSINKILGGTQLIEDGKVLNYPRLYRREDLAGRRDRRLDRYGWKSNEVSKDIMITDLKNAIKSDIIVIRDRDALHQLQNYQEIVSSGGRKTTGVPKGMGHDDIASALMIALQMASKGYHQMQRKIRLPAPKGSLEWWEKKLPGQSNYVWP